ncbi:MAG: hypothetical protein R3F43_22285 [bacterium]
MTMARLRGALLSLSTLAAAPVGAVELAATLGTVQTQAPGAADWQPAAAGPLAPGTRLRVTAGAGAQVVFATGAAWLRDGTEAEVAGEAELRLAAGGVQIRLNPPAGKAPRAPRFQVGAPCGQVGVVDGAAVVLVTDDEGCAISNHLGPNLDVRGARGGRVAIKRGAGVVVEKGRPGRPAALPAPPAWVGGKGLTATGRRAEDALVRGRLATSAGISRVRVRLRSLAEELPAGEAEKSTGDPIFRSRGLAAGTWAVEAVARDQAGLESPWSDPLVAEVQAVDGPVPLTVGVDPGLPTGCAWSGSGNAHCPGGDVRCRWRRRRWPSSAGRSRGQAGDGQAVHRWRRGAARPRALRGREGLAARGHRRRPRGDGRGARRRDRGRDPRP